MIHHLTHSASILVKQQTVGKESQLEKNTSELGTCLTSRNQCSEFRFIGLKVGLLGIMMALGIIRHSLHSELIGDGLGTVGEDRL